jgi:DNA-binding transcriptional LysR family regulator
MESLRGIVAFVRTVTAGSFSGAARQLGVTTVAVSRNVQRLERELGVRLLQRTTRSLSMTEEGRRLFEATRGALSALETAHEAIAERVSEPSGHRAHPGHHRIFAPLRRAVAGDVARAVSPAFV